MRLELLGDPVPQLVEPLKGAQVARRSDGHEPGLGFGAAFGRHGGATALVQLLAIFARQMSQESRWAREN